MQLQKMKNKQMKKLLFLAMVAMISFAACKTDKKKKDYSGLENASYALGLNYANKLQEDSIQLEFPRMDKAMEDVFAKADGEFSNSEIQRLIRAYFTDTIENPPMDKFSYALGYSIAQNLSHMGFDSLDLKQFQEGRDDFFGKKDLRFELVAVDSVIGEYQKSQMEIIQARRMKEAEKAKEEGKAFLAENATKEGVKTTASGLQYKVLKEGTGKQPKATDVVTVHYVGKLLDGTTFDSSVDRGQPATFGLNQVIPGWTEGVQLMKEGAKYRFFIPSDLAYGDAGNQAIPGGSTLIFDVELFKVSAPEAPKAPQVNR
ncbi:MAG TPA: FKBP-type peptidyl-prolyl cis-trans isomerase [Saprospiraceae bacterium]|nr:FKBP-type peptidyl-prolyl cis-trans isomerase [Saprospiraceae bacterium]